MKMQLTVSPDFPPERLAGWHIFNTWMQRKLDIESHFESYFDYATLHQAIDKDNVDIIYANAYDTVQLVRERGFLPLAKPNSTPDEVIIASNSSNPINSVEELNSGTSIAATTDPDIRTIGMIMLEPANLNADNTTVQDCNSYPIVAKSLIRNQADVGFFLADAYERMSNAVKQHLKPLVSSKIQLVNHCLLLSPKFAEQQPALTELLLNMHHDPKGVNILADLGLPSWDSLDQEEVEFMIDLMGALTS